MSIAKGTKDAFDTKFANISFSTLLNKGIAIKADYTVENYIFNYMTFIKDYVIKNEVEKKFVAFITDGKIKGNNKENAYEVAFITANLDKYRAYDDPASFLATQLNKEFEYRNERLIKRFNKFIFAREYEKALQLIKNHRYTEHKMNCKNNINIDI